MALLLTLTLRNNWIGSFTNDTYFAYIATTGKAFNCEGFARLSLYYVPQYVDVRLERKKAVLETYHKALHPQKATPEKDAANKDTPKKAKKRSSGIEL